MRKVRLSICCVCCTVLYHERCLWVRSSNADTASNKVGKGHIDLFFVLDTGFLRIKSGLNQSILIQQFVVHFFHLFMIILSCISAITSCPYGSSNNCLGGSWMLQKLYEYTASSLSNDFILCNLCVECQWPVDHLWIEDAQGPFVWFLAPVHNFLSSWCSLVFPQILNLRQSKTIPISVNVSCTGEESGTGRHE